MFNNNVAFDGARCNSKQELLLYEYIKKDLGFMYLKHIGNERSGKYVFKLDSTYEYETFCPDFIIEYININGIKTKLIRPLYIEYYGMYDLNSNNYIFQNYVTKTHIKNNFYKSNNNIYFLDLYPEDLYNLDKIKEKLMLLINKIIL
jgi:hypothetical protein